MFKKLLNVGKTQASVEKLQLQQQQQRQLFQLNEIKSYGFSHQCCVSHSSALSLLAVGSKHGLLRVFGGPSIEFNYQLESGHSIRQIEFVDCREAAQQPQQSGSPAKTKAQQKAETGDKSASHSSLTPSSKCPKLVVYTDDGLLHLFELRTVKPQNFTDNTTQTEAQIPECCQSSQSGTNDAKEQQPQQQSLTPEYTRLDHVGHLSYFKFMPDEEDRSKRVTTFEVSSDGQQLYVGTEGGNLYIVPLSKFKYVSEDQTQQEPHDDKQNEKEDKVTSLESDVNDNKKTTTKQQRQQQDEEDTHQSLAVVNLNDEPHIVQDDEDMLCIEKKHDESPFDTVLFQEDVVPQLSDDVKAKKQGAIESIRRHPQSNPTNNNKVLLSYHRGLSVIYDVQTKTLDKYFYHNQILECSCFGDQKGDLIYTSHNDGSYIKWDVRKGSQAKASDEQLLYGPYPCKPTPKIEACTGLVNDQLEDLIIFSGGMPRATYDDKNPVTIVRSKSDGRDTIKTVLDFTSKVLDFVVITRPRGNLGSGAKSHSQSGGGKRNKNKQQQQRNTPIAVALAILAEEEFVVVDLLNNEQYLEFPLPYLNCVHSSAITCNQHYSDVSPGLYEQLLSYQKMQTKGKLSANEWPIQGGKVVAAPKLKSHDVLLTGHEDGSVNLWDVSDLSMRHLLSISTSRYFSTGDDPPAEDDATKQNGEQQDGQKVWPPLKRVGRFDPYSDDTRLAVRKLSLCPRTGTLVVAGTGGQVLTFQLGDKANELVDLESDTVVIVSDQRFTWKGREKLAVKQPNNFKQEPGYQLSSYVQLDPPVAATSLDLRADWRLYALGTQYGFMLYDYEERKSIVERCTLNVQDFAIVSGDGLGAMSRKKSFRKSLRESFRRLRRGRSQRQQTGAIAGDSAAAPVAKPAFSRATTGVRTLNASAIAASGTDAPTLGANEVQIAHRQVAFLTERQVEQKIELSSIIKCITLTSAVISSQQPACFKPTLWVGTNAGQVLVYAIELRDVSRERANVADVARQSPAPPATEQVVDKANASTEAKQAADETATNQDGADASRTDNQEPRVSARLAKEIQLKHRAPIVAIFTSPEVPSFVADQTNADESLDETKELLDDRRKSNEPSPADAMVATSATSESVAESVRAASPDQTLSRSPVVKQQHSAVQPRVLICTEEQFKVFNLPNLKPFCKFKLTANEGLRAKKISITQFLRPQHLNATNATTSPVKLATSSSSSSFVLSASKSLQSFATQTSRPATPAADGLGTTNSNSNSNDGPKLASGESNNNSLSTLNNNHTGAKQSQQHDIMNAKFGSSKTMGSNTNHNESAKETTLESPVVPEYAGATVEPYMVCMSNQGDCAIYSVPDLKRQAQIQVCKPEDVIGITSTMLTSLGEGYYLKSSSNFLRFSISTQRVLRVLSVV